MVNFISFQDYLHTPPPFSRHIPEYDGFLVFFQRLNLLLLDGYQFVNLGALAVKVVGNGTLLGERGKCYKYAANVISGNMYNFEFRFATTFLCLCVP